MSIPSKLFPSAASNERRKIRYRNLIIKSFSMPRLESKLKSRWEVATDEYISFISSNDITGMRACSAFTTVNNYNR